MNETKLVILIILVMPLCFNVICAEEFQSNYTLSNDTSIRQSSNETGLLSSLQSNSIASPLDALQVLLEFIGYTNMIMEGFKGNDDYQQGYRKGLADGKQYIVTKWRARGAIDRKLGLSEDCDRWLPEEETTYNIQFQVCAPRCDDFPGNGGVIYHYCYGVPYDCRSDAQRGYDDGRSKAIKDYGGDHNKICSYYIDGYYDLTLNPAVMLADVIRAINLWKNEEIELGKVIDFINEWAVSSQLEPANLLQSWEAQNEHINEYMNDPNKYLPNYVALQAVNGQYVCAINGGGTDVRANLNSIGNWAIFGLINQGNGNVALQADNGYFLCAEGSGGGEITANRNAIGAWETFKLIDVGNGNVALQAANGQYLCAEGSGGGEVVANRNDIGAWETFNLVDLSNIAIQTSNGQYVCAEGGGGDGVVANRDAIGAWETFRLVDQGNSKVALEAHNGQFLCAEGGGGREVVANRDAIGAWETFKFIDLKKVALQAANGQYLCAEGSGGGAVVANRNAIGAWETFKLIYIGNDNVALQAANGQYLCAEGSGGGTVVANRNAIGAWETFKLIGLGKMAIQAANGQYICAEGGGEVVADRNEIGAWETLNLIRP